MTNFWIRSGSVTGSKHIQKRVNNQDSLLKQRFEIPSFEKNYQLNLVCDGCTGFLGASHTEVGAWLLPIFINARFQHLACMGMNLKDIPSVLYLQCIEYLRQLANMTLSSTTVYNDGVFSEKHRKLNAQQKFINNYLSATILGMITDFDDVIFFTAGDGVLLINDELDVIDQENKPLYPAIQIDKIPPGFDLKIFKVAEVKKFAIASDGLAKLMKQPDFFEGVFGYKSEDPMGLQYWLNKTMRKVPQLMTDDCTIIAGELIGENTNENEKREVITDVPA